MNYLFIILIYMSVCLYIAHSINFFLFFFTGKFKPKPPPKPLFDGKLLNSKPECGKQLKQIRKYDLKISFIN